MALKYKGRQLVNRRLVVSLGRRSSAFMPAKQKIWGCTANRERIHRKSRVRQGYVRCFLGRDLDKKTSQQVRLLA